MGQRFATKEDLYKGLHDLQKTMVTTMVGTMISFSTLIIGALALGFHR